MLRLGVFRVLETSASGRGFLKVHGPGFGKTTAHGHYLSTLRSACRLRLLRDVSRALITRATVPNQLAHFPELAHYRCFAVGWHEPLNDGD